MAPPSSPAVKGNPKEDGDSTPLKKTSPKVYSPAKRSHKDFAGKERSESEEDSVVAPPAAKQLKRTGEESSTAVKDGSLKERGPSVDGNEKESEDESEKESDDTEKEEEHEINVASASSDEEEVSGAAAVNEDDEEDEEEDELNNQSHRIFKQQNRIVP
jgi:hypothetical protein